MALKIEELDENIATIEWKIDTKGPGRVENTFQLNNHMSFSFRLISVSYLKGNKDTKSINLFFPKTIQLWLQWSPLFENTSNSLIEQAKNFYHDRPPQTVNAYINKYERFQLSSLTDEEKSFASPTVMVSSTDLKKQDGILTWTINIKFDDFRQGQVKHFEKLSRIYVCQTGCDVHFVFENGKEIGGHVVILSAMTPVFAAMFQHKTKEAQTRKVHIKDVSFDIFKQLLHYLYAGQLAGPLNEEMAQHLYEAADKYRILDLMDKCVEYLLPHIRIENALSLFAWTDLHSINKLKYKVLSFVSHRGQEICFLNDWVVFVKKYPELCVILTQKMIQQMYVDSLK